MNIVYLLLGLFAGIVFWNTFLTYIDPIIQLKQEVYKYIKTDEATYYNIKTQQQMCDFYREYPELNEEEPISTNAIGFQYYPETECDDEEDRLKNKIKVGFHNN